MNNIISKLFNKRGIKDSSELSEEEKGQFEQWQAILAKESLTVSDIIEFCEGQVANIEAQFKDLDNSSEKQNKLVIQHNVYKTLINIIKSPSAEKESLERYLTDMLK